MPEMERFRRAALAWARGAGGEAPAVRELAAAAGVLTVVLVEGQSDRTAIETLAESRARDLDAQGISVLAIGGATNMGRFLEALAGPRGLGLAVAGLYDAAEEGYVRRGLERIGRGSALTSSEMARLGFHVCVQDLEDELIRCLGADAVERVLAAQGDLRAFRTFQRQPAQRGRSRERQLRRFLGTISGRKARYARELAAALDPAHAPAPLDRLLTHV